MMPPLYHAWRTLTEDFHAQALVVWLATVAFLVVYYALPIFFQDRFSRVAKTLWAGVGLAFFGGIFAVGLWAVGQLYFGAGAGPMGLGPR